MSSNIQVQRICQHCNKEFTAKTTTTLYCSRRCNSAAYKQKVRNSKVEKSNSETQQIKNRPIEELKAKEFLTVREVAQLLNCSIRTAYLYIENGTIEAVNLGQRMTRVKRSSIDKLFEPKQEIFYKVISQEFENAKVEQWYSLSEVLEKYKITSRVLYDMVKRNEIRKKRIGKFVYVSKIHIDKLFTLKSN